ncbi:MAG: hypothetical protein LBR38_00750 [Synergistaceae bacterium]|jgi:DNA-binding phage protein|nr:hypothetical protein [Synergistaceae bacterium]
MVNFSVFDVVDYLDSEELIVGYLAAAAAERDPAFLAVARADAELARARLRQSAAAPAPVFAVQPQAG